MIKSPSSNCSYPSWTLSKATERSWRVESRKGEKQQLNNIVLPFVSCVVGTLDISVYLNPATHWDNDRSTPRRKHREGSRAVWRALSWTLGKINNLSTKRKAQKSHNIRSGLSSSPEGQWTLLWRQWSANYRERRQMVWQRKSSKIEKSSIFMSPMYNPVLTSLPGGLEWHSHLLHTNNKLLQVPSPQSHTKIFTKSWDITGSLAMYFQTWHIGICLFCYLFKAVSSLIIRISHQG